MFEKLDNLLANGDTTLQHLNIEFDFTDNISTIISNLAQLRDYFSRNKFIIEEINLSFDEDKFAERDVVEIELNFSRVLSQINGLVSASCGSAAPPKSLKETLDNHIGDELTNFEFYAEA